VSLLRVVGARSCGLGLALLCSWLSGLLAKALGDD
jgi:hypothetical protein